MYGLLLTVLHLPLFKEERSGKIIAETLPFGACIRCCAVVCLLLPRFFQLEKAKWFGCVLTDGLAVVLKFPAILLHI